MVCCVKCLKFTLLIFCILSIVCIGLSFKPNYLFIQEIEKNVTVTAKMATICYYSLYSSCGLLAISAGLSILLIPCNWYCPMLFISSIFTLVTLVITVTSISAYLIFNYADQTINVISIAIHFFTSLILLAHTGTVKGINDSIYLMKKKRVTVTKAIPIKEKSIVKEPKKIPGSIVPAVVTHTANSHNKKKEFTTNGSGSGSGSKKLTTTKNNTNNNNSKSVPRRPSTPRPQLPGSVVNSRPSSPVPSPVIEFKDDDDNSNSNVNNDQDSNNKLRQVQDQELEQITIDDGFRIQQTNEG